MPCCQQTHKEPCPTVPRHFCALCTHFRESLPFETPFSWSLALPLHNLNQIAERVVEYSEGDGTHLGRLRFEPRGQFFEPCMLFFNVIHAKRRKRNPGVKQRFLVSPYFPFFLVSLLKARRQRLPPGKPQRTQPNRAESAIVRFMLGRFAPRLYENTAANRFSLVVNFCCWNGQNGNLGHFL
jgi:hypothetical protein